MPWMMMVCGEGMVGEGRKLADPTQRSSGTPYIILLVFSCLVPFPFTLFLRFIVINCKHSYIFLAFDILLTLVFLFLFSLVYSISF